jgi:hypothetical protein
MLKDCCRVMDGAVLAPDAVVPPFALVEGKPGEAALGKASALSLGGP